MYQYSLFDPQSYATPPPSSVYLVPAATEAHSTLLRVPNQCLDHHSPGPSCHQGMEIWATLWMPKGQCEAASDGRYARRGDVELVDGPQNGFRVDAIVWREESGRYGVEDGRGGVGDVDDRPTGRKVE